LKNVDANCLASRVSDALTVNLGHDLPHRYVLPGRDVLQGVPAQHIESNGGSVSIDDNVADFRLAWP
jgi:hypothetical protein